MEVQSHSRRVEKSDREIIRVLKEIERKPTAGAAEKKSALSGLAALLPGLGALGGLGGLRGGKGAIGGKGAAPTVPPGLNGLAGAAGKAGAGGAGSAGAAGAGGAGGRLSGALKRVPILGAALGAYGIYSAASTPDDPAATPDQNRENRAGAVGGAVGGLAGGAAGAAAGGAAGALLGPPGALVGAIAGGIAGAMGGEVVGDKIGKAVSNGMKDAGVSDRITQASETARAATQDAMAKIKAAAEEGRKALGDVADKAVAVKDAAVAAVPQEVKDAAAAVAGKAVAAKDAAVAAIPAPVKEAASKTVRAAKGKALALSDSLIESAPDSLKPVVTKAAELFGRPKDANKLRAVANASRWSQGNISGLNDAQTKALVASTLETESGGGRLDVVNEGGYMGKYQAGAAWLAQAGMIRGGSEAVKRAKADDGFAGKSDWAWGKSGGMTKFLSKDENWTEGMSRQKYLSSHEAQDAAFKRANEYNYKELTRTGQLSPGAAPERVAGLLKAAHVAGIGGAKAVAAGGTGAKDANGTSARKYFDDAADDKNGYRLLFSQNQGQPVVAGNPGTNAPAGQPSGQVAASQPATASQSRSTVLATAAAQPVAYGATNATTTATPSGTAAQHIQPITAARTSAATVSAPKAPIVSPVWVMPSIPDVPKVEAPPAPINTESSDRPSAGQRMPVGQDLPDRHLAHIVTGGFGAQMR